MSKRQRFPDASSHPAKKKKSVSVNDALSSTFYDETCKNRFETFISQRKILPEKPCDLKKYEECGFTDYLKYLGLTTAATVYQEYYNKDLVQEFYSNLKEGNDKPDSEWYNKVYIRGEVVGFSGELINRHLGLPTPDFDTMFAEDFAVTDDEMLSEITGGVQTRWPTLTKKACVTSSSLSTRYFCLYQIAIHCWIPSVNKSDVTREMARILYCAGTKTPMNLGLFLQKSIVSQAVSTREVNHLPYLCLITALMIGQKVKVKKRDTVEFIKTPLKPTLRTFSRKSVHDLPWKPSEVSADEVKEAKVVAIDGKLADLRLKLAELDAERAKLVAADETLESRSENHVEVEEEIRQTTPESENHVQEEIRQATPESSYENDDDDDDMVPESSYDSDDSMVSVSSYEIDDDNMAVPETPEPSYENDDDKVPESSYEKNDDNMAPESTTPEPSSYENDDIMAPESTLEPENDDVRAPEPESSYQNEDNKVSEPAPDNMAPESATVAEPVSSTAYFEDFLQKYKVTVTSERYRGGGATGFLVPREGGGDLFMPFMDNHGFLLGQFSQLDGCYNRFN